MNDKIYSKVLVALQFIIVLLLLITNDSIFNNLISLFIFTFGLLFGIYTLYFNPIGNFNITPEIKENSKFIKTGIYKYIRHPMYFSLFLMMGGIVLTEINILNIVCFVVLIIVLYLKAKNEEKLWSEKLEEYEQYKKDTKMFIHFIF